MRRIWVTRDEAPSGRLCRALRAAGLEPVCEPVIQRRLAGDVGPMLAELGREDWLVLASRYAIEAIVDAEGSGPTVSCRVAVVGEASRRLAVARGLNVCLVSPDGTGAGLRGALSGRLDGAQRVCWPRSSASPAVAALPGVRLTSPILYETLPRDFDRSIPRRVEAAAVASPSAARILACLPEVPRCASIGPTTSAALLGCGIVPWVESPEPSLAALARAIAAALTPAPAGATVPTPAPRT